MKLVRLIAIVLSFFALSASLTSAQGNTVVVLTVKAAITPVVANYIDKGITAAERQNARAVIIEMDTPGGLDTSMREIVQRIIAAKIPVVVYVSPAGGRAASAGAFITIAAHIAAMAPNTTIGAAHPVSIGSGGATDIPSTMEEKVVNDAVAFIRSSAALRHRNEEWAEKIVRQSISATETEALQLNVIDLIASDTTDLVSKLNGRSATLLDGRTVTLNTSGVPIDYAPMGGIDRFLLTISNPNLAYILLSLAMLGILVELYNPGAILPGIVGGISLFLALYALGTLEANWAGLMLIGLAFIFFIAEALTTTFGMLLVGGIISMVLGSLLLFRTPEFAISPWTIGLVVGAFSLAIVFIIFAVVRTQRRKQQTGREGMIGKTGKVRAALDPRGTIFLHGELWEAESSIGRVEPGEEVKVTGIEGLKLRVIKA
ncbi:MAG: nodulation protein NfeD [Chloroflexi bacterium]|nr:nodulation protein NfeD [Chloroflexota bacterium]